MFFVKKTFFIEEGVPLSKESEGGEDLRSCRTALLHTVMAVQAPIQDKGRAAEDILLVSPVLINRFLTMSINAKI